MPGLIDIGLALGDLIFRNLTSDGETLDPGIRITPPVPVRFSIRTMPPYYNLPDLSHKFVIEDEASKIKQEYIVNVTPETHPDIFKFISAGGKFDNEGVDAGMQMATLGETRPFEATDDDSPIPKTRLSGSVSVSAALTT